MLLSISDDVNSGVDAESNPIFMHVARRAIVVTRACCNAKQLLVLRKSSLQRRAAQLRSRTPLSLSNKEQCDLVGVDVDASARPAWETKSEHATSTIKVGREYYIRDWEEEARKEIMG
jgi:hypothetical protein